MKKLLEKSQTSLFFEKIMSNPETCQSDANIFNDPASHFFSFKITNLSYLCCSLDNNSFKVDRREFQRKGNKKSRLAIVDKLSYVHNLQDLLILETPLRLQKFSYTSYITFYRLSPEGFPVLINPDTSHLFMSNYTTFIKKNKRVPGKSMTGFNIFFTFNYDGCFYA